MNFPAVFFLITFFLAAAVAGVVGVEGVGEASALLVALPTSVVGVEAATEAFSAVSLLRVERVELIESIYIVFSKKLDWIDLDLLNEMKSNELFQSFKQKIFLCLPLLSSLSAKEKKSRDEMEALF